MFRATLKTFEVIYSPVVFSSTNTHTQTASQLKLFRLIVFLFPPQEDQLTPYPPFETHNGLELKLCKSVGDWQCKDKHLDSPSSSPPWHSSLCSMWRQPTLFSTSWSLSAWSSERVRAVTRQTYSVFSVSSRFVNTRVVAVVVAVRFGVAISDRRPGLWRHTAAAPGCSGCCAFLLRWDQHMHT